MGLKDMKAAGTDILVLIISSIALVIFGLIFFLITLWIVKFAAIDILRLSASGDWIVLSAAILTAAAMIGSISKR
jgi:hypothetical protein